MADFPPEISKRCQSEWYLHALHIINIRLSTALQILIFHINMFVTAYSRMIKHVSMQHVCAPKRHQSVLQSKALRKALRKAPTTAAQKVWLGCGVVTCASPGTVTCYYSYFITASKSSQKRTGATNIQKPSPSQQARNSKTTTMNHNDQNQNNLNTAIGGAAVPGSVRTTWPRLSKPSLGSARRTFLGFSLGRCRIPGTKKMVWDA